MGVRVRLAALTDLQEILVIERGSREAPHWGDAAWMESFQSVAPERAVFVAEFEGAVGGFVVLSAVAGVAEIENIAVDLALRRQGMGRALCEAGMAWAREKGVAELQLEVRVSSVAARALYGAVGFEERGVRARYYDDPVEGAMLMVFEFSKSAKV